MPPSHTKWAVLKRWDWLDAHKILNQDAQGRVLISRERRALLLDERDKVCAVRGNQIFHSGLLAIAARSVGIARIRATRAILNIP
jgi:hypothetical protein